MKNSKNIFCHSEQRLGHLKRSLRGSRPRDRGGDVEKEVQPTRLPLLIFSSVHWREQIGKAACDWQTAVSSSHSDADAGRVLSTVGLKSTRAGSTWTLGGSLSSIMTAAGAPCLCHQGIKTCHQHTQHTQPFMN